MIQIGGGSPAILLNRLLRRHAISAWHAAPAVRCPLAILRRMNSTDLAGEQSRLLDSEIGRANGIVREEEEEEDDDNDQENNDEGAEGEATLAKEASTRQLLAVMGAIWVGVFFAALGNI